jgi:hypothetical protein
MLLLDKQSGAGYILGDGPCGRKDISYDAYT